LRDGVECGFYVDETEIEWFCGVGEVGFEGLELFVEIADRPGR
jgi:hypothetical protein